MEGEADAPLDFRFVEANPAFTVQSGFSGVVGRTLRQVIPDDFEAWLPTYEAILETGKPIRLERGLVTQGRVLELHAFRVEDETHHRIGVGFTDITDRKRSEEALRRSEGNLRDFVENASVGLHWVGSDGIILWANKTELDLLGYTREEYFGHHIAEFHADQPVIEDILVRLTGGETLLDYEARLRCKDGSIRHVLINSNTLFENAQFVHTRCFTRDITQRMQAEEALRENEWRLRYAMESAKLTYVEADLTHGGARTAENFAAVMGYPSPPEQEDDVAAGIRVLLEHVVPHDRLRVDAALQKFATGTPLGTIDYRVLGDDGIERWIESRWSVELGPDGKSTKSFATNLDITELKQIEGALRKNEERIRLALESAELGTFNIDPATDTLTADERFRTIFGVATEPVDYERAFALVHPDDRAVQRDAVAAATRLDHPVPYVTEYRVVHPDGTVRWIFAKGRANFVQEGSVRKLLSFDGTVADITERKQAEEALRESEAFNRSIIESSPDCIKILDMEGNLLSMHNGQQLLGIDDIRPFLNKSWVEFWEGDDRQAARAAIAAAKAGKQGNFVGFFRTLRGEPKWWDVSIAPILDANDRPERLLAVSRDVTRRKQAEMNLAFLASVSLDLVGWTSVDEMMQTVGAKLAAHLKLSLCAFVEINEAADQVVIAHDWHRDDVPGLVGVYRLADFVGDEFIRTARAGETIVVRDIATDPRTDLETFAPLKIASFICVPLIRDGQWRFALCLYQSVAYDWQEGEIELARELTTGVWMRLEQLRSEEALRESEERYRTLFDSMDEGYCIFEVIFDEHGKPVDYRYLEVNPSFEKQNGLHAATGKRVRELVPDLESSWFEIFGKVALTGEPVRFVNEAKALGRWFDLYAFRVGEPDSRKVAVLFTNITERKQTEQQAEMLSTLSRELAGATDEAEIVKIAVETVGRHLNAHRCYFVECLADENRLLVSRNWVRDDAPSIEGELSLFDFGGLDWWRQFASGDFIIEDVATNPLTRANSANYLAVGVPSYAVQPFRREGEWTVCLVVTERSPRKWTAYDLRVLDDVVARVWPLVERARADLELRASEERYRNLFNSMDEGFCVIEMIFDEHEKPVDWRYLEVNPAFEKQSGMPDPTGKRILESGPTFEASWFETFGTVALTGEPFRFVNEVKALNGWFDVYAFRVGDPQARKVAVILSNISERRKSEQALRESAEALVDLDRRKDEFLAMLGHELRNPLAPISNAVHLLRLQKNEDPLQQQARNIIERQVGQLTHLVDELLEISRINTGRIQLRQERIVVSGIVERAVETSQPLIAQRRHELTVSLPPQPIWLHADAARLEQVVVNLLNNAAKYTDEGGHIWLTVRQEGDAAVLRVRDTGIGIAPELLPRVFDLFTQAERALDRSQGGLGIGLSLVQRLVELHGGTVEASSVLGQGSEFVLRVPVMRTSIPPTPSPSIESAQPHGKSCRVLVVDDNEDSAESLAMLLEISGHAVWMAHDGPTALEATVNDQPDLVLLDIGLPGLDGFEVAKRIRQQPTLKDIVLVAMTGYGQATDRQRSQEAGFDHHLVKPVDFDELQNILATVSEKATVAPRD